MMLDARALRSMLMIRPVIYTFSATAFDLISGEALS